MSYPLTAINASVPSALLHSWLSALAALCVALLLACNGCPSNTPREAPDTLSHDENMSSAGSGFITEDEYEILPIGERMYLPDGERDFANKYSFAVMVNASMEGGGTIMCSGALVSPRLVLTAGHCVCATHGATLQGNQAHSAIDGSNCARRAAVVTVTYAPSAQDPRKSMDSQSWNYDGEVRPHPALEILLDERGVPLFVRADLAAIVLDRPVEGPFPAVQLPTSELKLNEPFTIAGYGLDGQTDLILGLRRFGRKRISRLSTPGNEGILFAQDGAAFTSGSGEPCLRQDQGAAILVGITTLVMEEGFALTSTYPYRSWLLAEIRRVTPLPLNPRTPKDLQP